MGPWPCAVGYDLALLWLGCRRVATAPMRPRTWELQVALKSKKRKRKKKEKRKKKVERHEFQFWVRNNETQLVSMGMWVRFLASLGGLGIWCCHELWCRSQMHLGSRVAVAVV